MTEDWLLNSPLNLRSFYTQKSAARPESFFFLQNDKRIRVWWDEREMEEILKSIVAFYSAEFVR